MRFETGPGVQAQVGSGSMMIEVVMSWSRCKKEEASGNLSIDKKLPTGLRGKET